MNTKEDQSSVSVSPDSSSVDSDLPSHPMLREEIPLDIESVQASFF